VFSPRYQFSGWPNPVVPRAATGVYAIWDAQTLVYCGRAGTGKTSKSPKGKSGLFARLSAHASGRLSGDQFCVYIANRFIVPALTPGMLPKFATEKLKLDSLAKDYIRARLEFQFAVVGTKAEAMDLEQDCRRGVTFGQKPFLNPL
jgi:hypothetical protein